MKGKCNYDLKNSIKDSKKSFKSLVEVTSEDKADEVKDEEEIHYFSADNQSPKHSDSTGEDTIPRRPKKKVKHVKFVPKFKYPQFIEEYANIYKFIKVYGIKPLYNGVSSAVMISIVQNGTYFLLKNTFKKLLGGDSSLKTSILSNLYSAVIVVFLTNPLYVLNMRMANQSKVNRIGNIEMLRNIYNEEGIKGLFKGIGLSLLLVLNPLIQYTLYESLIKHFQIKSGSRDLSSKDIVISTFLSKFVTTVITYPIMTLKSLTQSDNSFDEDEQKDEKSKDKGFSLLKLIKIIQKQGFLSLYNGFSSKFLGSEVNSIVFMLIYEKSQILTRTTLMKLFYAKTIKKS